MKRVLPIVFFALGCVLVAAQPAVAQSGIIRWIEKLSGPGDFVGVGYEFFPLCYGHKSGLVRSTDQVQTVNDDRAFAADLNCRSFRRDGHLVIAGFQVANLWGKNNLTYDSSVSDSFTETVEAMLVMGTIDVGVGHPAIDVGFGAGFMRFSGMPAPPFNHGIYHVRLAFKPLAFRQPPVRQEGSEDRQTLLRRYQADWLQLRLEWDVIPGGLDDSDFGAVPGSFPRTSTETGLRASVAVNLGNVFKW